MPFRQAIHVWEKYLMRKALIAFVALVCVVVVGGVLWQRLTYEPIDLSPLSPHASTQNIARVIASLQSEQPQPDTVRFVVLGDTRSNIEVARTVVQEAVKENPKFIIHTGDLVRRGRPEEYLAHHMQLVEIAKPIPIIPIPGNHEEGPNNDFAPYLYLFGQDHFDFDYANVRFVGVNNSDRWGMTRADLRFLDEALSRPGTVKHKFVFFHIPPKSLPITVDSDEGRGFRWNQQATYDLMAKHQVDEVFMGHVHGFATKVIEGVRYTVCAGGGAPLAERLPEEGRAHNYVVVTVTPDGVRRELVRWINGQWVRSAVE
jgi:predicted phosphodiesterase